MLSYLTEASADEATPITLLTKSGLEAWLGDQPELVRTWLRANNFTAEPDSMARIPDPDGGVARVVYGVAEPLGPWSLSAAPAKLKQGSYRLDGDFEPAHADHLSASWALGTYRFNRYKRARKQRFASLVWPSAANRDAVTRTVEAIAMVRDLINTPASDLGPRELAEEAQKLAERHSADIRHIIGEALEDDGYPAVYAVGKGSSRAPRLIDLSWQPAGSGADLPRVTIVGKGVVFDSGGLDIKPAASMKLMKKDMGGAAHTLGLCHMIMAAQLPVRLRMLIPAVENSVSGDAFRPLDVLKTRKGLTVEVGNTDAEGRLILCDALAEADREPPALLIDFATLTGAARVALGTELAAMFSNDDALAEELLACSAETDDPMWRMPLYQRYAKSLNSKVADICNISDSSFGGAITAALFLDRFVSSTTPWVHFDVYGWNPSERPGRPSGGEAFAIRAVFRLLEQRFGK
ncbi:MAG: leucyl aminopeptidase family protein [Haliangiales bacterium]